MTKPFNIKNLYYYLVCLVTLFLIVGGAIATINNAVHIALPDRPNITLMNIHSISMRSIEPESEPFTERLTLEELEKKRAEQEQLEMQRRGFFHRRFLNAVALTIIPVPFYLYHWKQIKPGSQNRGVTDET